MAYYKFKDGTTSLGLEKKEHFELLSNSNLFPHVLNNIFALFQRKRRQAFLEELVMLWSALTHLKAI